MIKNIIVIAFRNLVKNRVFVTINILGLGMALACCITAFLNWDFNNKFDAHHVNASRIYRVNFIRNVNDRDIPNGSSPMPLGSNIRSSMDQVDAVIRYYPLSGNFKIEDKIFRAGVTAVDPEFFDAFTFPLRSGSVSDFKDKSSILISQGLQEKYFPDNDNPVEEVLQFIRGDQIIDYKVVGVFEKPPLNNSFDAEAYFSYDNVFQLFDLEDTDWSQFNNTFLVVNDPGKVTEIERQLEKYVEIQNIAKADYKVARYYLDPFVGLAVRSERDGIWNHWLHQSVPTSAIWGPIVMSVLILLIACFNFTNTSIAIANRRIKEIGIRKVLGSNRWQLIYQFLGENTMIAFLALIVGVVFASYLVPLYSALWPFLDIELNILENRDLFLFIIGLLLFTAVLAGSYPALYVSSYRPTTILRGRVKFSGTNPLTRILLTAQFAISLLAIICGFAFVKNAEYQKEYDMGFDQQSIVYARLNDGKDYAKMRNELMNFDKIRQIAGSTHSIGESWYTDPVKDEVKEMDASIMDIGTGYLETVGATILKGRDFNANSRTDVERSAIVNEELVDQFQWENPIGKRILLRDTIALSVIGVVKNIFFEGALWDPLEPMIMKYTPEDNYSYISVRADVDDLVEVRALMDEKWKTLFPNQLSNVAYMEEVKAGANLVNSNIMNLFLFLGALAVTLSTIGLFSLVSLNLIKRMKEIGVRKVLGASISSISLRVSKEFIYILIVASVIGSVGAYYLSSMLMGSIWTYHTPARPSFFIVSILILLLTSGLTLAGKIIQAASVNPATILRDE